VQAADLQAALTGAGISPTRIERAEPSLEDVFLVLSTGEKSQGGLLAPDQAA
jgi:hypothetical protein